MPKRIQMTRKRPWRKDHPDAVIVDRRTKWGNVYRVGHVTVLTGPRAGEPATAEDVVNLYRAAYEQPGAARAREWIRHELAGRDLACWCPLSAPCHADVLIAISNSETDDDYATGS